jgi:cyclin-C
MRRRKREGRGLVIHGLAQPLQLRQQVVATAIVYFRRFYVRNAFRQCDPVLLACTCIYLACKVEECPPIVAHALADKMRQHGPSRAQPLLVHRHTHTHTSCRGSRRSGLPWRCLCAVGEQPLLRRFPYSAEHILECEFFLLEELDGCVAVFHPYRPLLQYAPSQPLALCTTPPPITTITLISLSLSLSLSDGEG